MASALRIHPRAVIGDGVQFSGDATIGPGAVLLGPLKVGHRVWIGPNAVIGTPPEIASLRQNAAWDSDLDHHGVEIGDDVVIRELSTVHQGSHRATTIGSGTWLLNSVYVAHDCLVGEQVTLSAGVRLGGHSEIGDHANVGMNATVHQRRIVGPGSMIGMGSPVTRDVPPFSKAYGSPIRLNGVNEYVLRKLGASPEAIGGLAAAYAEGDITLDGFDADPVLADYVRWWLVRAPQRPLCAGGRS
jgi:UDP-N-acetylglucosamine acyltransferase